MKKNNFAFTIVEMLLYMALLTIFVGILVSIFVGIMKSQVNNFIITSNEYDSRFILQRMSYDLTNAQSFTVPNSTTLNFVKNGINYSYSLSDTNLLLDSDVLNSPDTKIENLVFTKIDNSVQVKFDMNGKSFQETFNLR